MNSSNIFGFSEDDLADVQLWKAPYVGQEPMRRNAQFDEPTQLLTVDEIERMQSQAYEEAYIQGREEGFAQGYQEGHDTKEQELQQQISEFQALMLTLSEPFKTLDEQVEKELVALAISVATQIIRREIKMDPGQVVAAVRQALKVLPLSSQKISLRLHPEDSEMVRNALSLDEMQIAWNVVEDPLITRGGCHIDTEVSHIDASVENRLAAVIATLFGGEREQDKNR